MAFVRPTLEELIDRAKSDMSSRLLGGGSVLRRAAVSTLARVHAGAMHLLYGYLQWIARQCFPDTADAEYLEQWASIWGVSRKPADFSQGNVTFTGINGTMIPAGTEIQRSDGMLYTTDADATIASGTATAAVTATAPGATSDEDAGTILSMSSPIAGIDSSVTVAAGGLSGGLDPESDADLLARLLERIQSPPHGGSASDYEQWALEVAGVTRAWCIPSYLGAGTVGVAFVRDNDSGSIIPGAPEVQEVQDYIDERRPVAADVTVFAPTAVPLNFTIAVGPNTAAVKAAVQAELEDLILREAEPGGTLLLSHIREAISRAAGENDHTLTAPSANVTVAAGQLSTMGVITWS